VDNVVNAPKGDMWRRREWAVRSRIPGARLPSPFLARSRRDPLGESWTHADGAVGHFTVGSIGKGDLALEPPATQFIVVEAKMFSGRSPGVKNAPRFDQAARLAAGRTGAILVIDEVQKALGWSESVKRLWDEDTRAKRKLRSCVLPGSAPLLGQLHDAGNTTTLAHDLELLDGSGLLTGLAKFSGRAVRQRSSSPKLQVLNTALMSAQSGRMFEDAREDREFWGRLVESAIGAHLANAVSAGECELFYWRERNRDVDFVVRAGRKVAAIEVKSGRSRDSHPGLAAFGDTFHAARQLLVGGDGIPVQEFLLRPTSH
jgi:hypothetical protein